MVSAPAHIITPGNTCTACNKVFHEGDKAICLVKVPTSESDTLCLSCWALILASSIVGIKGSKDLDAKGLRRLFLDALDVLDELKGTEGHRAPTSPDAEPPPTESVPLTADALP